MLTDRTGYLKNTTSLSSPVSLTIPASVGPSANYYSLALADLTANAQQPTYSNRFNLTGGTGNYTDYESALGGAPFWNASDLPCTSYACARQCAQAGYPNDLSDNTAYDTMKQCILQCPGVSAGSSQSGPSHSSNTGGSSSSNGTTTSASAAVITLSPGNVITAVETTLTSDGKTLTEAILGGSQTLQLGGPAATISSETVSLLSNGVEVGGTTTVAFSNIAQTAMATTTTTSAAGNAVSSSTGSSAASATASAAAAAGKLEVAVAGLAGAAGLAAMLL